MLGRAASRRPDAAEFLHLAAVASLTEVAVEEAGRRSSRTCAARSWRSCARATDLEPRDIVRRAARLGCDLSRGAVVLCAELATDRPRHVVAMISGDVPGRAGRASSRTASTRCCRRAAATTRRATLPRARALADRLRRHGKRRRSRRFHSDPAELAARVQEAELVLDVLRRPSAPSRPQDIGTGTYRLLFRVLASHPEEVRSFYEDTVAPIVRYDDQYRDRPRRRRSTPTSSTNCNMNATAAAIYAHRHTVAYRLDRVRELTGLDPTSARTASASASASRPTGSSRRGCRSSASRRCRRRSPLACGTTSTACSGRRVRLRRACPRSSTVKVPWKSSWPLTWPWPCR